MRDAEAAPGGTVADRWLAPAGRRRLRITLSGSISTQRNRYRPSGIDPMDWPRPGDRRDHPSRVRIGPLVASPDHDPEVPAGREAEAALLRGWSLDRDTGPVLVRGAVGSGRTTLLRWLGDRARAEGWAVLATRATTPLLELPLGVWSRLLAQLPAGRPAQLRPPPPAHPPAHPSAQHRSAGSPAIGGAAAGTASAPVRELLEGCADRPTLVLIDDVHGADTASLELLVQLGPLLIDHPIRVVLSLPAGAPDRDDQHACLLAQLVAAGEELTLGPLEPAGIADLVVALVGEPDLRPWAERAAPALAELGGHRPLLLVALVRDLRLRDGARPDPRTLTDRDLRGVRQVVRGVLRDLAPEVRRCLEVVALAEGRADAELLAAALDRPVGRALAAAEDAGLLVAGGGVLQLTSRAYAEELRRGADDLAALQARLGAALLRAPRDRSDHVLALRHLVAAGSAVDPALRRRAAERVLTDPGVRFEPALARVEAEALEALWRPELPTDPGWHDLGLRVADAWFRAGNRQRSWGVAEELLGALTLRDADDPAAAGEGDRLVAAALAASRGRDYAWSGYASGRWLLDVIGRCGQDHPRAPLLLARAAELLLAQPDLADEAAANAATPTRPVVAWQLDESGAVTVMRRALDQLHADTPTEVAVEVRRLAAVVLRAPDQLAERHAHAVWALAHARTPEQRGLAAARVVLTELERGDRRAADRALGELTAVSRTTDDAGLRWREHTLRAMLALASGEPARAAEHRERAFLVAGQVDEPGRWLVRLVQVVFGDLEQHRRAALPPLPDREFAGAHPLLLAGRCLVTHRLAPAVPSGTPVPTRGGPTSTAPTSTVPASQAPASTTRAWSLPVLVDRLEEHTGASTLLLYAAYLADAAVLAVDVRAASRLLAVLEPYRDRIAVHLDGFHCHGSVSRLVAGLLTVLGRDEEADDVAAEARTRDTAAGLTSFVLQGELDALHRDRARGRRPEPEVRAALLDLAARADARELGRLADDARRAVDPVLRAQLRARELDVLRLLAVDRTNAQIAAELGFSSSTIRKDTIRLFRLLEVDSRRRAVVAARERGLIA